MSVAFAWALAGLFVMSLFGGGLAPLPISAYVLWMGKFNHPWVVIFVGALGSMLGFLMLEPILRRLPSLGAFCAKRTPDKTESPSKNEPDGAKISPWAILLANALPLPVDPLRFLALKRGARPREILPALTAGRVIRYALLVFAGEALAPYAGFFWAILALMLAPALGPLAQWLARRGAPWRRAGNSSS
ncbi:MAG: hypothetical protein IPK79_05210 [Vampirovibrionales bacterium]|nr:hypothetical protein [Vampirovibrionales bacterium]